MIWSVCAVLALVVIARCQDSTSTIDPVTTIGSGPASYSAWMQNTLGDSFALPVSPADSRPQLFARSLPVDLLGNSRRTLLPRPSPRSCRTGAVAVSDVMLVRTFLCLLASCDYALVDQLPSQADLEVTPDLQAFPIAGAVQICPSLKFTCVAGCRQSAGAE